ncbi:oxidoreductase [Gymnopilus junonius]|uniref:Oxidoreductase n=1 Tax=Gymnopilus junonius TaxID=109634 RepID=A0A9P5NL02_GYMJU|nr:oxidoreductase [Gymnopilus junonius]
MSRVVLVTGCSAGGIGHSLCEEFASKGCKVYATARNISKIDDFPETLPVQVEKLELDVNNEESIKKALAYIEEKEGRIDVLVNNAGVSAPGPLVEVPIDQVKNVFETNTFAILRMCRAVVPIMSKHKSGTIVNIGSIVGEVPTPWSGVYSSSKAATLMISEILTMELSPFNISVVHVAPGAIKSNIANNSRVHLAANSLYQAFVPFIQKRIDSSQGPNSMPTKDFARRVVGNALRKSPKGYMTMGGHAFMFSVFKWLPRGLVFYLMLKRFFPRK